MKNGEEKRKKRKEGRKGKQNKRDKLNILIKKIDQIDEIPFMGLEIFLSKKVWNSEKGAQTILYQS